LIVIYTQASAGIFSGGKYLGGETFEIHGIGTSEVLKTKIELLKVSNIFKGF